MTIDMATPEPSLAARATPVLEVRNLSVDIGFGASTRSVLDHVSFSVMPGEALGIVGESGSGKSMSASAVMGLLPANAHVTEGQIFFDGADLLTIKPRHARKFRGNGIGMVLQDPLTALDPSFTIGSQIAESLRLHRGLRGDALLEESAELLRKVRIPSPAKRLQQYPHELSGGMRQRVCSAIALAGQSRVLIADEPTTALDVTTQAQYLAMLKELQASTGFALILITHDLSIIQKMCDSLIVMYAGHVVEQARPVASVIDDPQHPYTKGLFDALPRLDPSFELRPIDGQMPAPGAYPAGCRFAPRCIHARSVCSTEMPALTEHGGSARLARCFGTEEEGWISSW